MYIFGRQYFCQWFFGERQLSGTFPKGFWYPWEKFILLRNVEWIVVMPKFFFPKNILYLFSLLFGVIKDIKQFFMNIYLLIILYFEALISYLIKILYTNISTNAISSIWVIYLDDITLIDIFLNYKYNTNIITNYFMRIFSIKER